MAKLQVNDTPSQQVLAKAAAAVTVHDSTGRAIELKKPVVLAQYRLIEILGDSAKNETYTRMVLPLIYVASVDGEPVVALAKKSELEALIQRLDEHGIAAVMNGVAEHFGAQDPEKDKAALKN